MSEKLDNLPGQDKIIDLKKKLSFKIKLSLEDMRVEKKDKSDEDQGVVKLEEELKIEKNVAEDEEEEEDFCLKTKEGKRSSERSCGAKNILERSRGLGLGVSPRGKIGTAEKKKKKKKFGKKVDQSGVRECDEHESIQDGDGGEQHSPRQSEQGGGEANPEQYGGVRELDNMSMCRVGESSTALGKVSRAGERQTQSNVEV